MTTTDSMEHSLLLPPKNGDPAAEATRNEIDVMGRLVRDDRPIESRPMDDEIKYR